MSEQRDESPKTGAPRNPLGRGYDFLSENWFTRAALPALFVAIATLIITDLVGPTDRKGGAPVVITPVPQGTTPVLKPKPKKPLDEIAERGYWTASPQVFSHAVDHADTQTAQVQSGDVVARWALLA